MLAMTVLYDPECGLCRRAHEWLAEQSKLVELKFVPCASDEARRRFPQLNHDLTKNDLTVILKWDGKSITGSINPGPNAKPLTSAVMDITPGKPAPQGQQSTTGTPPIFHVKFEADGMTFEGTIKNPVAVNRQITGTWSRGAEKGTFQIRRL